MRAFNIAVLALLVARAFPAQAQTTTAPPTGVFATMEACEASSAVYTPAFLTGHKPLRTGEGLVTLPQRQCGEMFIAGGRWAIVAQAAGTEMVTGSDGRIVRRWDCGNAVRGFVIPAPMPTDATQKMVLLGEIRVHHTFDTLQVRVSGELRANLPDPSAYASVGGGSKGFWCFRSFGNGFTCATGLAALVYGGVKLFGGGDKPEPPPEDKKVEKVSTLPPCTALPCGG